MNSAIAADKTLTALDSATLDPASRTDAVRSLVETWIAEYPRSRSIATLARQSGIDSQKLRRMLGGQSELTFAVASKIVGLVVDAERAYPKLAAWWPAEASALALIITHYQASQAPKTQARPIKPSTLTIKIFGLASRVKGLALSEVEKSFGSAGISLLNQMVQANILHHHHDRKRVFALSWPELQGTESSASAHAILDICEQRTEQTANKLTLQVRVACVSPDKLAQITQLQRKYLQDLEKIIQCETTEDNIPVYMTLCTTELPNLGTSTLA